MNRELCAEQLGVVALAALGSALLEKPLRGGLAVAAT